jgi:hypothetical protein
VCDIGHVLGLSWFMVMMSRLGDVMRVVVVLVTLLMSSRLKKGGGT